MPKIIKVVQVVNIINNCKRLIKKSSLVKHIMKVVGNSLIRKKQEYLTKNGYSLLNRVFSELKRKNIVAIPVFTPYLSRSAIKSY